MWGRILWGIMAVTCGLAQAQVYEFSKPNVPVNDDSLGWHQHYPTSAGKHGLVARGDTLYATWYDNRDGNNKIYFSKSTNGGTTWCPNVIVHDTMPASHFSSAIAVSNVGVVYVCWDDDREQIGMRRIYCAKSIDGGATWGRNVPVMQTSGSGMHLPSICTVQNGRILVAWIGGGKPQFSMSTDGGQSFGANYIMADSLALVDPPTIGVDDSGLVYAAFSARRPSGVVPWIWFTKSKDSGDTSFLPPMLVSDTANDRKQPTLVTKPNGDTYIAFYSLNIPWVDIFMVRSTDRGRTFGPPMRVSDVRPPDYWARNPSIASDTVQGVYVAWFDNRWGGWDGFFSASTNGGNSFAPSVLIEDTSGSPSASRYWQNLAVDPRTGTAYVIWSDERNNPGAAMDIYSARGVLREGVEELSARPSVCLPFQLSVQPNPFTSFASVPGHEKESFSLYDVSGRKVGAYKGDKIGFDVSPGIYFLRQGGINGKLARVVKVR